jgi:group I intron endonuclease
MTIYKITNIINDKIYIGKTTKTIEKRFNEHIRTFYRYAKNPENFEYETRLYSAMLKYGIENFKIEKIVDLSEKDDINEMEIYYISLFDSINHKIGYNISPGGLGGPLFKGHKHSKEAKIKMSKHLKGKPQSKEFIIKRTKNLGKKIINLETREIFNSVKEAKNKYGSSVGDALRHKRRASNCHFVELSTDTVITDDFIDKKLTELLKIETDRKIERANKLRYTYNNKSMKIKNEIKNKRLKKYKNTIANRTDEKRLEIGEKISKVLTGKKSSDETRKKISETSKHRHLGKHWYNNSVEQLLVFENELPQGYKRGMLPNYGRINK